MCIRNMRVLMAHWVVPMPVTVVSQGHDIVGVRVMSIRMRMGMLVFELFVVVLATVRLK